MVEKLGITYAEANVSAEEEETEPHARLPEALEAPQWTTGAEEPQEQEPEKTGGVMATVRTSRRDAGKKPLVVVISKKIAKHAVLRNRFKRRVREIVRPLMKPGVAYLVIAHPGDPDATFEKLKAMIVSKLTTNN